MISGGEVVLIERKTYGKPDEFGIPTENTQVTPVENTLVAPGGTATDYGITSTSEKADFTLYLPRGTEVFLEDVFIVRGERFARAGGAQVWQTPPGFTLEPGVVVSITRTEGAER